MASKRHHHAGLAALTLCMTAGCATHHDVSSDWMDEYRRLTWTPQDSNCTASLRGIAVVNTTTAWATGSDATVLRTTDADTARTAGPANVPAGNKVAPGFVHRNEYIGT